jgi:capsular exopolysaccharide synthesis family protein
MNWGGVADKLSDRITIDLRRNTRLVDVSVLTQDPEVSAKLANALVEEFMRETIVSRSGTSKEAYQFLVEESERLRNKLQASEKAMPDFKDVLDIKNQIIDQEKFIGLLKQRYKDKHPKMIQAYNLLHDLRQEFITAMKSKTQDQAALAAKPGESVEDQTNRQLATLEMRFNALTRDLEADRTIYAGVLDRIRETDVSKEVRQINYRIVEKGFPAPKPSKPKVLLILVLAIFVGLLFGAGLVFLLHFLDSSLKTVDEAENFLGLAVLGAIPEAQEPSKKKSPSRNHLREEISEQLSSKTAELQSRLENTSRRWTKRQSKSGTGAASGKGSIEPLVMVHQPHCNAAEAFRTLRAAFSLLRQDQEHRTYLFTSALPSEGKSFTCANTALVFGQQGLKILLIDADLRRPTQQDIFQKNRDLPGLSNALASGRPISDFILPSGFDHVDLLLAGQRSPNPAELLGENSFNRIVSEALQRYDRVIVDSAPINAVSDTVYLLNSVDTVCLVIRATVTPRRAVLRAVRFLQKARARLAGTILNRLPIRSGFGSDPYYYYYSATDGYGDAYGNASESHPS